MVGYRKIAKYFLVGVLVLGLSLLAAEAFLRISPQLIQANTQRFPPLLSDEYIGVKMPPNIDETKYTLDGKAFRVRTTSLGFDKIGFRDDGINGSVYAIALGDSFAYGHGSDLQAVWTEKLEAMLGEDVVNMGVPSYSTEQEARLYKRYGVSLHPKLVIVIFFENDYLDNYLFRQQQKNPENWKEWVRDNLALYKLYSNIKRIWFNFGSTGVSYMSNNETYTYYPTMYNSLVINYTLTEQDFQMLRDDVAYNNESGLLVVYVPYREYFYRQYLTSESRYDFDSDVSNFYSICSKLKLNCIDTISSFNTSISLGKNVYLSPTDGHLNEQGNLVLANIVFNHVKEELGIRGDNR